MNVQITVIHPVTHLNPDFFIFQYFDLHLVAILVTFV